MCPVSALVAPLREENERGRDIPRPYVILPPLGQARCYAPGDQLLFSLTLFGNIVQLLPYIVLSIPLLESGGLGRKLSENRGQRGRFSIQQIESYQPFTGERKIIYQVGKPLIETPTLTVSSADVLKRAATLPKEKITIDYLTPARITAQEKLVHHATFYPFIQRLLERLAALEQAYGIEDGVSPTRHSQELIEQAQEVVCIEDATTWEDVQSYSHRQKRSTPIGGIIGKVTFSGNLAPFHELLTWGELIHVGKNTVKGNGWYKLEN